MPATNLTKSPFDTAFRCGPVRIGLDRIYSDSIFGNFADGKRISYSTTASDASTPMHVRDLQKVIQALGTSSPAVLKYYPLCNGQF